MEESKGGKAPCAFPWFCDTLMLFGDLPSLQAPCALCFCSFFSISHMLLQCILKKKILFLLWFILYSIKFWNFILKNIAQGV